MTLFASRGIDQAVLEIVPACLGVAEGRAAARARPSTSPTVRAERRLAGARGPSAPARPASPSCRCSRRRRSLALLYVDSQEPHFCDAHDLDRLSKFSRIVAKSVNDTASPAGGGASGDSWEAYLERTPVEDMEREKLLLLLNRNEWNIARVARMMGVTRRTVYLRLQRYNIPRERVPKSRLKNVS